MLPQVFDKDKDRIVHMPYKVGTNEDNSDNLVHEVTREACSEHITAWFAV